MVVLDSSFLIDLMNDDEGAVAFAQQLEEIGTAQRVPSQVVYELYVGVGYRETAFEEVEKIQSVLDSRPIADTTEEIAKHAGRIDGQLRRDGERIGQGDIIIGATAVRHDESVVTRNREDFERIQDVEIIEY